MSQLQPGGLPVPHGECGCAANAPCGPPPSTRAGQHAHVVDGPAVPRLLHPRPWHIWSGGPGPPFQRLGRGQSGCCQPSEDRCRRCVGRQAALRLPRSTPESVPINIWGRGRRRDAGSNVTSFDRHEHHPSIVCNGDFLAGTSDSLALGDPNHSAGDPTEAGCARSLRSDRSSIRDPAVRGVECFGVPL